MAGEFDSLFKNLDSLLKTKTIIGDPMTIDDAVIIPIMEVSFGMASGSFAHESGNAGAMSARMTPVALYVLQNGIGRVVNIKNTDAVSKVVDLIPDFVNKVNGKKVSPGIVAKAKKVAEDTAEK